MARHIRIGDRGQSHRRRFVESTAGDAGKGESAPMNYHRTLVGRDACRLGIAPWGLGEPSARYPETTRGIAPYNNLPTG